MYIEGFGVSGYRSFVDNLQEIGPLKKINIFVGANNAGKSNVLLYVKNHLTTVRGKVSTPASGAGMTFSGDDVPVDSNGKPRFLFGQSTDKALRHLVNWVAGQDQYLRRIMDDIQESPVLIRHGCVWMEYAHEGSALRVSTDYVRRVMTSVKMEQDDWRYFFHNYTGGRNPTMAPEEAARNVLETLKCVPPDLPQIQLVPAIRKVGNPGNNNLDYGGGGLIKKLFQLQNPTLAERKDSQRDFKTITELFRRSWETSQRELTYRIMKRRSMSSWKGSH